jgi:hypothetical protein
MLLVSRQEWWMFIGIMIGVGPIGKGGINLLYVWGKEENRKYVPRVRTADGGGLTVLRLQLENGQPAAASSAALQLRGHYFVFPSRQSVLLFIIIDIENMPFTTCERSLFLVRVENDLIRDSTIH